MKAVILAAGMGTRLRPMTESLPKGLIEIDGKSLLQRSLENISKFDIKEVIIVTGFYSEHLKKSIGKSFKGIPITYVENNQFSNTGSMFSMSKAKELITDDILLLESDLLYEEKAIQCLLESKHSNAILTSSLLHSGDDVYVCTNDEDVLTNLGKNIPEEEKIKSKGALVGISKYSKDFLNILFSHAEEDYKNQKVNDHYEERIFSTVQQGYPAHAEHCEELNWIEIDNEQDLERANKEVYPKMNIENNNKDNVNPLSVKRSILLNPGPATTTNTVKYSQIVPDICPREKEFGDVMKYINNNLVKIAGGDLENHTCVLFGGSGTAAMDATINSVVPPGKKILVINNGAYGKRIAKIARAYRIGCVELKFEWDSLPDLKIIESQLQNDPEISCVAMVHHETTTGLLNPVKEIGILVKTFGKTFIVDTISSFAGVPINIKEYNINFMMSTSNKCIQGMAGVSFIICDKQELEKIKNYPRRSFYLSLYDQYNYFLDNYQMRFTPPVQTLYALKRAIEELLEEGYENRISRYTRNWQILREGVIKLGFKILTEEEEESRILITLLYPENSHFNFDLLHDKLYEEGFTIYPGKIGKKETFRLSIMGDLNEKDMRDFLSNFEEVLNQMKTFD
jgi:2-aminoethylphosphonate-pyruvate transaminase